MPVNMNTNMPSESSGKPVQTSGTLPAEVTSFAARKEARARELAAKFKAELPPAVWAYFAAATRGSWPEVARLGEEVRNLPAPPENRRPGPAVVSQVWAGVMETYMAFAQFALGEPKYAFAFGRGIIQSIPPGSIYFGGTDAGRGLVTALCRSHETGDPFFTLTQNALADRTYLRYLREVYGGGIFIPSDDDLRQAIDEYSRDLERREKENRLIPGEKVERVDGKVQLTGQISVMAINGALSRLIFDRNPRREFFVEESFPLQWMYPHLAPNGLIMAIRRQPLAALRPEEIEQDRLFWSDRVGQMLGDWSAGNTPERGLRLCRKGVSAAGPGPALPATRNMSPARLLARISPNSAVRLPASIPGAPGTTPTLQGSAGWRRRRTSLSGRRSRWTRAAQGRYSVWLSISWENTGLPTRCLWPKRRPRWRPRTAKCNS